MAPPFEATLIFSASFCSVASWQMSSLTEHVHRKQLNLVATPRVSRTNHRISPLHSAFDNDDSEARSQFGTKEYWDSMYNGMGDFPSDEYCWYYGWEIIKPHFTAHVTEESAKILVPGVGNDSMLLDLSGAGYLDITAFDYSESAVERQEELLSYDTAASERVALHTMDARALAEQWTGMFDAILEKGALDALYLSGDGNVEKAAHELRRVLRTGGICVSVSGVVPEDLRREIFPTKDWEWLRDGSHDLKAGCFVWRKR